MWWLIYLFFVLTALSLILVITLVFWSEINDLLRGKWLLYIITNAVLFHGYFSVRHDVLNSWKCDKPHLECKQIKLRQPIILPWAKMVALLQMPEIRGMDSLLIDFYNVIHLAITLKDVFSCKSDAFRCINSNEAGTCISTAPVWTGASEPYPAFAEMNGAKPNCYE